MANDLNNCNFIGRLGKDVEIRYMPSGGAVASFSIAVGSQWTDKQSGEKREETEWVNLTAFGKLAEICEKYLTKGSQVFVSGRMKTDKYEKDGVTRYSTKVIVDRMQMLGSRGDNQQSAQNNSTAQAKTAQPAQQANVDDFDDDIPF